MSGESDSRTLGAIEDLVQPLRRSADTLHAAVERFVGALHL